MADNPHLSPLPMPPPVAGQYRVYFEIPDEMRLFKGWLVDYWDGAQWPFQGGYRLYKGWLPL